MLLKITKHCAANSGRWHGIFDRAINIVTIALPRETREQSASVCYKKSECTTIMFLWLWNKTRDKWYTWKNTIRATASWGNSSHSTDIRRKLSRQMCAVNPRVSCVLITCTKVKNVESANVLFRLCQITWCLISWCLILPFSNQIMCYFANVKLANVLFCRHQISKCPILLTSNQQMSN